MNLNFKIFIKLTYCCFNCFCFFFVSVFAINDGYDFAVFIKHSLLVRKMGMDHESGMDVLPFP